LVVEQRARLRDEAATEPVETSEAKSSLLELVPSEGGVEERSDDHAD
jgi:hypothetical protein